MVTGTYLRLILGKATSAVKQFDRLSIDGTGLHITDFMILEALLNKGSMNISTVGEKVLLTSGSMTAAANRLKKKGFIERVRDPLDGRSYYLHLTQTGLRLISGAYQRHSKNLDRLADCLTLEERHTLITLLKKLGRQAAELNEYLKEQLPKPPS
jgi:MarR family 2-MHQ and catechol resistance regulon transcriptional repressor